MSFFRSCAVFLPIFMAAPVGFVLNPGAVRAQTGAWTAPCGGYVYDPAARAIQPVVGLIGAASVGSPVALGLDWASLAPNQKSALAGKNGSAVWIPDLAAAASLQTVEGIPAVRQVLWAADSTRAVVLTSDSRLFWLTGFDSSPVPLAIQDLDGASRESSGRTGRAAPETARIGLPRRNTVWRLLAADSSAGQALLVSHAAGTRRLWLASSASPPRPIPFPGLPSAAVFVPASSAAFAADAAGHRIVRIDNMDASPSFTTLVSSAVYVDDPAAMALSADGDRLFLADRADRAIRVFDSRTGGAPGEELSTAAPPVSLTLSTTDRFLINEGAAPPAGQPFYFLTTGNPAKVLFVPREQ